MSKRFLQRIMTISCVLLLCGCGAKDSSTITMEQYPEVVTQTEEMPDEQADAAMKRVLKALKEHGATLRA